MKRYLVDARVNNLPAFRRTLRVLTACPKCGRPFRQYSEGGILYDTCETCCKLIRREWEDKHMLMNDMFRRLK